MKHIKARLVRQSEMTGEAWEVYELTIPANTGQIIFEIPHNRTLII